MTNFSTILLNADPDQICYIYQDQFYTIKDIQDTAWTKVNALAENDVKPKQRVLLIADDSIDWISTFWALSITGCCIIILHIKTDIQQIQKICSEHSIDHIITDQNLSVTDRFVIDIAKLTTSVNYKILPHDYSMAEPFVCFSTSGTTGSPKLTVHTNYSLYNWGNIMIDFYRRISLLENETMFCLGKTSFVIGFMNNIVGVMFAGTKSLIGISIDKFKKLDQLCSTFSVSAVFLTPHFLDLVLNSKIKSLPDNIKTIACAGEPLTDYLTNRCLKKFDRQIVNCYGLSESCINLCETGDHKSKSVGCPLDTVNIKIIDDTGNICASGQTGTIFINTPGQTIGYLDDPDASSLLLIDNWINTRDLGYQDHDGNVIFQGRKNSCIKHKGLWISLLDTEQAIQENDLVQDCIVVLSDPINKMPEIVAFIVPNDGIEQRYLREMVMKQFKQINCIRFIENIPTSLNLKKIRNHSVLTKLVKFIDL